MKFQSLVGPVVVLLLWFFVTTAGLVGPLFLPSPVAVAKTLSVLLLQEGLVRDIGMTLLRVAFGFVLGSTFGVPIGILMGLSERVYRALDFLVDFFRSIPVTALFPLFLLLFGIGDVAKMFIAAWSCCLVVLINSMYGVKNAKPTRRMVAKTLKATRWQVFMKVVLPDALPQVVVGMRTGVSLALIVVVVTEMFMGTEAGLGQRIFDSSITYQIPEMYAAILVSGTLGYALNRAFVLFETRAVHWAGK